MTACNFRSLLLAAIVLSNCITWTASRHHYAHNVHQHRTRHRRQGAGLYLSASYVIPGGEGSGAWGEWGEVSPCSRTCGGGVASQKRICLQLGPDGQPECSGGDTKYFSCQTQDCPSGSTDFRAEQCSEFDDKEFRGYKYNWVPYTKAPHACELNCMPHGERFYFRHKSKVIDGTRCNDESFDVCVNGACQPVGCDMMLGSNAREDKCRECRGNGANCHTTDGLMDSQDLVKGYNDILLIPQGSTTIVIEEIAPSNNYLALRAKNGTYYLNGHYHIDFPRSIMIAGALWYYERSQQGYAAPDKLRCLGPTTEPLYLSLLLQDENVGIKYEYSVPNDSAPPTDKRYNWVHEDFTPCSATCGLGFQTRNVTCRSREELEVVDDGLCDEGLKPPTNQTCNPDPCPPQWVESPWGECSKRCGSGGVRSREVTCQKIIANGYSSIVADKECFDLLGPKPELFQECNQDAPCPTWFVGRWKPCDQLCDAGTQSRQVVCYQKNNGRIEVLDDKECTDDKPEDKQPCFLQPCDGVDWVTSNWTGCDTCLSKIRARRVVCTTKERKVLDDSFCAYHERPVDQEECDKDKLPPCQVQWYATQWSKCSADCGEGVKTRKIFCGLFDGDNVSVVEDSKCASLPKYNDTKPCTVPKDECPSQWFAGPWTNCSKPCGGGEQDRLVMCFRGDKEVTDCDFDEYLDSTRSCNTGPCDKDETLPVDPKSTPIMDDEECDYDTDYPEVGLDADSSVTALDMMLSDSPGTGYAELEATLGAETGSGDESTTFEDSSFIWTMTTDSTIDTDSTTDDAISGSGDGITETESTDKDKTTKTTITLPTSESDFESTSNDTESTDEETGTTPTSETDSTEETESSGTSETGSTESSATEETGSTPSAVTVSESSDETNATATGETGSSPIDETDETNSTLASETGATVTEGTKLTGTGETATEESSVSPSLNETESTDVSTPTSETGSEETGSTGISETATTVSGETGLTDIEATDSTGISETQETGSTESTVTEETNSTVTEETESTVTEETESTVTEKTESTVTEETESTVTEETESTVTEETESTVTEETESTVTEETESTVTEKTESTVTEETESTVTEETESTVTEETESTVTEETESTVTEETESTVTEETESTVTEKTESTVTEETETTDMGLNGTEITSSDETTESTVAETKRSSDDTTRSTITFPTEENTGPTESSASSETTEPSIGSSESSIETSTPSGSESTTDSGSTISSAGSESTTVETSTSGSESTIASSSLGSESTTISGSTETSEEGSTSSELSTEVSGSTLDYNSTEGTESSTSSGSESTDKSTVSSSTAGAESTTEDIGSTTEQSTVSGETEISSIGSTEEGSTTVEGSTQESAGTEESTTSGYSTTEGTESTEVSGSTLEGLSTTEAATTESVPLSAGTTTWDFSSSIRTKKPFCRPRRRPKCNKTKFGCCPDKKTIARGAFDEGCPKPHTCKESTYGCCPDGLSPAEGDNNEGCPVEPCADTLFGCCLSDNKTAAQGNDQDGCPPPPPACLSSTFGCCADNETEATGPAKEGCPESETTSTIADTETTSDTSDYSETSTPSGASEGSEGTTESEGSSTADPCATFKYGCCADNETEAPGPDGQGCPCNTTEFGCCSDGVSPANGVNQEGCPGPCSSSQHGCCQDGKTPAHGPDLEGCCLLQAFGCCPDNRKPAEGPHLEGCGCQFARHGCCPDNVTIAQGPENKGCGCQYTEHGCCPDGHTEASGPNNEGCGCNTYQFGCCADGVTIAKGPRQLGCACSDSTFGCCGDGVTPAAGPNRAGCDCSSSQHGCCPDGHSEATGPKFLGCTDAPENKQAVCSMSTDPGSCHNFTAMWYYDLAYGGCSRFWYGGCEGNGNRFATKEDCEDVCVQPSPKDSCKLPSVKGPCDADYVRWHYNSSREQCIPFRYGGCLGNANNFDTRELCQKQCEPDRTADQCSLPIDQGSCAGNFSRWGYNTETHSCDQFIWGGCEGNSNRFSTEAACQMRCNPPGVLKPQCTEPQEAGNCSEKEALWSFSQSENRCVPFYYSGCGGNSNRFSAQEDCEQTCPSAYTPDKCTLPYETGQCANYREKWYYDTSSKRCIRFYYGGCGGNENKFDTEAECLNTCSELAVTTTTIRPAERSRPQQQPQPEPEPERPELCFLRIDAGPCNAMETRYAYDKDLGKCKTFEYGGCGGNQNNFPNEQYCTYYCHPAQDICQLPMLSGPCDESVMRWFYDPTSDSCSLFTYGGCEGNDNRFESLEACESRCRTGPVATTAKTTITTPAATTVVVDTRIAEDVPPLCRAPESLEECSYGGEVWYFDQTRHECVSHINREAGAGAACRYTGTFASQEACERSCGAFRGVDVCQQRVDPGPCQSYVTKVYFDITSGQCHEFAYGGCLGGANRFSTVEECSQVCKAEIDPCTLPPEEGKCFSHILQWYYDAPRGICNQFVFTGCSGNENRFETQQDCEARCKRPVITTTTVSPEYPPQTAELECTTPSSLAPCGENETVFYYDSERRQCLASGFGRCGHANSYSTEEECERRCGAFRGVDVCGAHLDPGPCRASIPKFYWDSVTGSCQSYAYGGCAGGPNRFSTVDECERICGATGPARACLQAVDTGVSCDAAPAPRWHYSAVHVDCIVFAYQGCGGNDNNFHSYDHCADVCKVSTARGDDCDMLREECDAIICQFGIERVEAAGCQRCLCKEDPCMRANCSSRERCVAIAIRNPDTQEPQYSARCVAESNEILDCEQYVAECASLHCEYGVQRTRTADGCERCACVQVEIDCEPLHVECERIKCTYGIKKSTGTDGCERCSCNDHPCTNHECGAGERCVALTYNNGIDQEPKYSPDCRLIVKPGFCPVDEMKSNEVMCRHECNDDADCRGAGKCCRQGCSNLCSLPEESTSAPHTTTYAPDLPAPPQAVEEQEAPVAAAEGGTATLRCLFHGNPPPKITWRRGELTIDGSVGRYRLKSDGALEIVSLYRNDTGVYICVADNGLGVASQEIRLVVSDPVRTPVGIAGDENAVVTGELNKPLFIRCLAYGYPPPTVFWYHGLEGTMVPYNDAVYEARGNILLIRSLAIETLGEYTCQAYNGEGKAASWVVAVQAYRPKGFFLEHEYLVPRYRSFPAAKTQPPTTKETTTTTTTTTEARIPMFTVPVSTHVSTPFTTLNIGAELRLTCEVDGFPDPDVHWTKDGATIQPDDRISITGSTIVSRLLVSRLSVGDSGLYACHASNAYSSHSDTAQINVQQLVVPAKCTDNPFFANCDLIVRSKFCRHKYYSKFCCKSCVEAGQLDPQEAELQADQPYRRK